jgi:predicted nucleotidyltransferase
MAKKNHISYIEGKEQVNVKKYLYVIRPIAMIEWLLNHLDTSGKIIQIDVNDLFKDIKPTIGDDIYEALMVLNKKKQKMAEGELTDRVSVIDKWVDFAISPEGYERIKLVVQKQPKKCEFSVLDELLFKYLRI